jgi:hypothetical protein
MTRFQPWLQRIAILALLFNIVALGIHYYVLQKRTSREVLPAGVIIGPVTGVDSQGNVVTESAARAAPCHVVRYTSIHCQYCRKDEPSWTSFEKMLRERGCDSTILAPMASDLPKNPTPRPNQRIFPVVAASVAQQTVLAATPITIVLDHDWKVVWSAAGMLQPQDMESALSSLRGK